MDIKYHLTNLPILFSNILIFTLFMFNQKSMPKIPVTSFKYRRLEVLLFLGAVLAIFYGLLNSISFNASLENIYAASGGMNWTNSSSFGEFLSQFNLLYSIFGNFFALGIPILFISLGITALIFTLYFASYYLIIKSFGLNRQNSLYLSMIMIFGNVLALYYAQFYSIQTITNNESHGILGLGLAFLCCSLLLTRRHYWLIGVSILLLFSHPTNFLNLLSVVIVIILAKNAPLTSKKFVIGVSVIFYIILLIPLNVFFRNEQDLFIAYLQNWDFHRSPRTHLAEANTITMMLILCGILFAKRYFQQTESYRFILGIQILAILSTIVTFLVIQFDQISLYNILIFGRLSNLVGLIMGVYLILYISKYVTENLPIFISTFLSRKSHSIRIVSILLSILIFMFQIPNAGYNLSPFKFNETLNEKRSGVCANLGDRNVLTNRSSDWILRVCGASILIATSGIDWIPYRIDKINEINILLKEAYGLNLGRKNLNSAQLADFAPELQVTKYWTSLSRSEWNQLTCKYEISAIVTSATSPIPRLDEYLIYTDEDYLVYRPNSECTS
jgi:hypothetical protein